MDAAIEAMKRAFAALSAGRADVPLRIHLSIPKHDGVSLIMPSLVGGEDKDGGAKRSLAVKVISLFPGNADRGLARIQAAVLAIDAETGRPEALLEGAALTAIRTGAASGAATDLLAREDARTAAVFGAGVQARTQLEAVCTARSIDTAWVYSPVPGEGEIFAREMAGVGPIPADLRAAASGREAVAEADIVCTATVSGTPVFDDVDLKPGVHVNAIGSYQEHVQEIPSETVARAVVVVDSREAALSETGDLIQPIRQGLFTPEGIHAELGELVAGKRPGRTSAEQCTFFKAVGVAVQDTVAAQAALQRARQLNLGCRAPW